MTFRFGDFECDAASYELRRKGRRLPLARQPMELLLLLLQRPRELVSREKIARRLWNDDVFVDTDAGIRTAVLKIRQVLDDSRGTARYLETVAGKGYRFVASVEIAPTSAAGLPVPSTPSAMPRRHNLPADLTSFVGRHQALADLTRLLSETRLLSLIGPGGVGKTRLALRLAGELAHGWPGGVWLVDLASVPAPEFLPQSAGAIFGVRESPHRSVREALLDYLRDKKVLLLFDTCEHLIDPSAELIEAVLRAAPGVRIIATSREALRLPGETVYTVPMLSMPASFRSGRMAAGSRSRSPVHSSRQPAHGQWVRIV